MEQWYPIPGFKLYEITRSGKVRNIATGKIHVGNLCGSGYWNHHLVRDNGKQLVIGLHRLIAFTFIPNDDPEKIVVNHIDGNKLNNEPENLEWLTILENIIHAGKSGLSPKCLGITLHDPKTGKVIKFDTILAASEFVGISKDSMRKRYWKYNGMVFPEGYQYQKGDYNGEWEIPNDIEGQMKEIDSRLKSSKIIEVKDLSTGEVLEYKTMTEAAKTYDINLSTLSVKMRDYECPVFPPHHQFKFLSQEEWRVPSTLAEEFKRSLGSITIVVENVETGEKQKFLDQKELLKEFNISKTSLYMRFKNGRNKSVDGYYYYHEI